MQTVKQLLSVLKELNKSCVCVVLLGLSFAYMACSQDNNKEDSEPFLNIENGQFEVDVIVLQEGESGGDSLGSGSISFDFLGDISGTYSASGPLVSNQTENDGVGAILTLLEGEDLETTYEGLSLLGFHPTGDRKVDVFLLSTKIDAFLPAIEPGNSYGIGPLAPFNGLFLNGLDITEFWAGEANFIETADRAFVLKLGLVSIASRDSTHFTGSFFGTTHPNQTPLSKEYLVR